MRKNEHGYTVGTRADEGIGPYVLWIQNACILGGDANIAPRGETSDRSEKRMRLYC